MQFVEYTKHMNYTKPYQNLNYMWYLMQDILHLSPILLSS